MRTEKKFDCVKMMREIRDKIDADISKMTPEQIVEYIRKGGNEYKKLVQQRSA